MNNNKSRPRSGQVAISNSERSERVTSPDAQSAYVALVSLLVVSSVIFVIGMTLTISGIGEAQMGLAEERGHRSFALAEGCAEDVLLTVRNDAGYSGGSETYPEGSCTVGVDKAGDDWTMTISCTADGTGHTKKVEVKINRGAEITITGWKEIE